jgi:hypothetical protein
MSEAYLNEITAPRLPAVVEIDLQNSDRAAVWEPDLRHVKGAGARHIMDLFLRHYLE